MKFKCTGCGCVWDERKVFRVEQFSKSAFCRVCSCKCNPMIERDDLMKYFNMSEEDLEEEKVAEKDDVPPPIPAEDEEAKEYQITFDYNPDDIITRDDDDWGKF